MRRCWMVAGMVMLAACGSDPKPSPSNDPEPEMPEPEAPQPDPDPQPDPEPEIADIDEVPLGPDGRPVGWTDESHSKDGAADYETVFPQDRVNSLELRCSEATWDAMLDDLSDLTGAPVRNVPDRPSGGPGGGDVPYEWVQACKGLAEDDGCDVGGSPGVCLDEPEVGLFCLPDDEGGGGDLPPEAFDACEDQAEESDCSATFYRNADGLCLDVGAGLACIPLSWLEGGPGGGGDDLYAAAAFWSRKPAWFNCDVIFEGRTWHQVGVRFKGNSTLAFSAGQTLKLPLRLDFDEFEDDHPAIDNQRFFGFKQLSTANNIADPSFLRQKMTADLFRSAGVAAPQTAFYRFHLGLGTEEAVYMGLYTVTEVPRKSLLEAQFGDDGGTLYKCDGRGATFETFHPESFHRKTNKDSDDYSDVEAFIEALNADAESPEAWREGLEATFDVEGFLRFLALNQAIVNWDTYGALAHNYYLYGNPALGGRLSWLAWDFDLSLSDGNDLSLDEYGPEWPLLYRLAGDPVYMARYRVLLAEVLEGPFERDATIAEIRRLETLVRPHTVGAEGEQPRFTVLGSEGAFDDAIGDLIDHVRGRDEAVGDFLAP